MLKQCFSALLVSLSILLFVGCSTPAPAPSAVSEHIYTTISRIFSAPDEEEAKQLLLKLAGIGFSAADLRAAELVGETDGIKSFRIYSTVGKLNCIVEMDGPTIHRIFTEQTNEIVYENGETVKQLSAFRFG